MILGGKGHRSEPLRLVRVRGVSGEINPPRHQPERRDAHCRDLALLYKQRWGIEYFFRWVKCVMGCGHWMAESRNGATHQIHLALIASLLLQLQLGKRPSRRVWELMRWHSTGMADAADVARILHEMAEAERRKEERQKERDRFFRGH